MKFLKTKEVAKLFGCGVSNVQRLIRESKLNPVNPNHTTGFLFDENYIQEQMKMRKEAHHE